MHEKEEISAALWSDEEWAAFHDWALKRPIEELPEYYRSPAFAAAVVEARACFRILLLSARRLGDLRFAEFYLAQIECCAKDLERARVETAGTRNLTQAQGNLW